MARNLTTARDIETPTDDYPNGRQKDGASDGTLFNEVLTGDILQLFAKVMRNSGLEYNDLPDNETNDYQLFQALFAAPSKEVGNDSGETTLSDEIESGNIYYRKIAGGTRVEISARELTVSESFDDSLVLFTLPEGFLPLINKNGKITRNDGENLDEYNEDLLVASNGDVWVSRIYNPSAADWTWRFNFEFPLNF